jgi:hypothetical protein
LLERYFSILDSFHDVHLGGERHERRFIIELVVEDVLAHEHHEAVDLEDYNHVIFAKLAELKGSVVLV